jgi:hypothetical protein
MRFIRVFRRAEPRERRERRYGAADRGSVTGRRAMALDSAEGGRRGEPLCDGRPRFPTEQGEEDGEQVAPSPLGHESGSQINFCVGGGGAARLAVRRRSRVGCAAGTGEIGACAMLAGVGRSDGGQRR